MVEDANVGSKIRGSLYLRAGYKGTSRYSKYGFCMVVVLPEKWKINAKMCVCEPWTFT